MAASVARHVGARFVVVTDVSEPRLELARRMGSTQPAIARLEAGRVAPSLDTLDRAAAALGVELVVTFQHPQRRDRRQLSG